LLFTLTMTAADHLKRVTYSDMKRVTYSDTVALIFYPLWCDYLRCVVKDWPT